MKKWFMKSNSSLNSIFYWTMFYIVVLVFGFAIMSGLIYTSQAYLLQSQEERYNSYLLADELRQSSDDLTRLARTYAVTGDEKFEDYYWKVLDIRNGIEPRPENYNRIYWDLVVAEGKKPRLDSEMVSLVELMERVGITEEEFAKLAEAQNCSDKLVTTEIYAMDAIKGMVSDEARALMLPGESTQAFATRIMFDRKYHEAKGTIMSPIDDFLQMLDERTKKNVERYAKRQRLTLYGIVAFIGLMLLSMIFIFSNAISKLKQNEDNLKQQTIELQDSIDRLRMTQSKLVESEKMASLGGLVAGVTHEINTPIGLGITLASNLEMRTDIFLKKYQEGNLTQNELEKYFDVVNESSATLTRNLKRAVKLIESFKHVAVDQSSDKIRSFDVKTYFEEILTSLNGEVKHTHHKIDLICPDGLEVVTYPGAVYQIYVNFIMNSLKHGFEEKDEGHIVINVEGLPQSVKITYEDNGVGVPEENLEHIFDPFFTTKEGQGGSGLGLNIVYNLVTETLAGSIECQSVEGEYTRFIIEFPLVLAEK